MMLKRVFCQLSRLMTKQQSGMCAQRRLRSAWAVWSDYSLFAWRKLGSLATHWAHREDSDQTGLLPRLICVFTGRTLILLVLSWGGSSLLSLRLFISDALCSELEQERQIRFSMQQKLKGQFWSDFLMVFQGHENKNNPLESLDLNM